ncbi:MAG TPA: carboxypeptidase-like regulatory domain-containing protein, partial [Terriglobales bacterium]
MKHWYRFVQSILPAKTRGLAVLCVLLFVGSFAFAQEATVVGTVTDPSGSVLPNVTVTITSSDTGQAHTFTTNDAGQYVAPGLVIGHYSVKAEAAGFKTATKSGVVLNVGDRDRVDFAMSVGSISEK